MAEPIANSSDSLRQHLRHRRRALDQPTQTNHALALAQIICATRLFRSAKNIACYLANDGEIDPRAIIDCALSQHKSVLLPVLSPVRRSLYFAPYTPGMAMRSNRFGILEPQVHPRHWRRAQDLDLILLPLVAFDLHGHRVGMGGGFYDRSLAFRAHRVHRVKPHLIGLAHELQKVAAVNAQHWDIPLDAIATEQHIYPTGNV